MAKYSASGIAGSIIECFGIVFVLLLMLVGVGIWHDEDKPKKTETDTVPAVTQDTGSQSAKKTQTTQTKQPESKWQYSENQDKMRGTTSHFAMLQSDTKVDTGSIGKSRVRLYLRSGEKNGDDVFFTVDSGVFHCMPMRDCTINVKFDGGNIETLAVVEGEATLGDTLFISDGAAMRRFVQQLKSSKTLLVEFQFVNHGSEQFEFDTRGLKWSYF